METNFFKTLFDMSANMDWRMTFTKLGTDRIIVSVLPINESIEDQSKMMIQPMVLKGTPAELDAGFFESIKIPAAKTGDLFANMGSYLDQVEIARKSSKMEEGNQTKERKDKEQRKKKFDEQMKKVIELEEKEKFGEAIGQMPKADQYPEQAEEIANKLDELRGKHKQASLF